MSDTSACQVRRGELLAQQWGVSCSWGREQSLLSSVEEKSSSFRTDSQQCHFLVRWVQIFSFLPQSAGAWLYILTLPWAEQTEKTDTGLTDTINLGGPCSRQMEHKVNCFTSGKKFRGFFLLVGLGGLQAPWRSAEITSSYMSGGPVSERFFPNVTLIIYE